MKNKYFLMTIIFLGLQFQACNLTDGKTGGDDSEDGLITFRIDSKMAEKDVLYSTLVEDYYFIPLETKEGCYLSQISEIEVCDSLIFIRDNEYSNPVLCFELNGAFLNSIGTMGEGPEEYEAAYSMSVDPILGQVDISDAMSIKSYAFSGNFIESKRMNFLHSTMKTLNDSIYCFMGGVEDDRIFLTNREGEKYYGAFPYRKATYVRNVRPLQRNYDGGLRYVPYFFDTVYNVNERGVSVSRIFDFGSEKFTYKEYKDLLQLDRRKYDDYRRKNKVSKINQYYESENWIACLVLCGKKPYILLYDKVSGNYTVLDHKSINNDLLLERGHSFNVLGFYNDYLMIALRPDRLIENVDDYRKSHNREVCASNPNFVKLEDVSMSLEEDDNPVLMFVRFASLTKGAHCVR